MVEVHTPTPEAFDAAVGRELAALGLTLEGLAQEAKTGAFSSARAAKLWGVVGSIEMTDEAHERQHAAYEAWLAGVEWELPEGSGGNA